VSNINLKSRKMNTDTGTYKKLAKRIRLETIVMWFTVTWHKFKMWKYFRDLAWTEDEVLDKTSWMAGSLDEAINYLTFWLMENYEGINHYQVRKYTKKLVIEGFSRNWE
jgi:hypothetical protein